MDCGSQSILFDILRSVHISNVFIKLDVLISKCFFVVVSMFRPARSSCMNYFSFYFLLNISTVFDFTFNSFNFSHCLYFSELPHSPWKPQKNPALQVSLNSKGFISMESKRLDISRSKLIISSRPRHHGLFKHDLELPKE